LAVHREGTLGFRVWNGRRDIEELLGEDGVRKARIPSIESTHFSLIASELDATPVGFREVAPQSIVTLSRTDEPRVEAL
jgi:hypothetical protein